MGKKLLLKIKKSYNSIKKRIFIKRIAQEVDKAIRDNEYKGVPVLIISYNNSVYVESMVKQLNNLNIFPIVIDNCSNSENLKELKRLKSDYKVKIVFSPCNYGHDVGFKNEIYTILPDIFAYTDPDLLLHQNITSEFLKDFANLTEQYQIFKVGCALSLYDDFGNSAQGAGMSRKQKKPFYWIYSNYSVLEWESQFWQLRLENQQFELYSAKIDTTLAVYNKRYYRFDFYEGIRVAGNYSAIHLPWFPNMDIMSSKQRHDYFKDNLSSTWHV